MGQAGAQREPSMEEILASIRRIIENNESDRPLHVEETDHEEAEADAGPVLVEVADRHSEPELRPVPADAAEPRQPMVAGVAEIFEAPAPRPVEPVAAQPALSLADVAARVRAETAAPVATVIDDAAVSELHDMLSHDSEPADDEPHDVPAGPASPVAATVESAPERTFAPSAVPVEEAAAPVAADEATAAGQLISVDAGARVAASFEALNQAVAAGSLRSFDEIAEDLLRPMLQTWLDDNLPTLVERLVREEIERVSRGPRR